MTAKGGAGIGWHSAVGILLLSYACATLAQSSLPEDTIEIPSCLRGSNEFPELFQSDGSRAVVMLLDETTTLPVSPKNLRTASIAAMQGSLVQPGTYIAALRFSAFGAGRNLSVMLKGRLDEALKSSPDPDRPKNRTDAIKKRELQLARCVRMQRAFYYKSIEQVMLAAYDSVSPDLKQSEVLGALVAAAKLLQQREEEDKVLFVVSDMLEHSSFTSFYQKGEMRSIDPNAELRKVESAELLPNLQGVRVFILGAWSLPDDAEQRRATSAQIAKAKKSYRDPKIIATHEKFWNEYFARAGAKVVEIGKPEILGEIQ